MARLTKILVGSGIAITALAAGLLAGRYLPIEHAVMPRSTTQLQQDLSTGYTILHWTLENEARVENLLILKTLTFDRPTKKVIDMMHLISDAADNTLGELAEFQPLAPPIVLPEPNGKFGEVLQAALRKRTKGLLLERSPDFEKRMLISQAQALSMISVLAQELAQIDPNERRKIWLARVSADYAKMYDVYLKMLVLSDPN